MRDQNKTKQQLIDELQAFRQKLEQQLSPLGASAPRKELRQQTRELSAPKNELMKVKEDELKKVQLYAQNLIHSSLDMIIAVDKDRKIIKFNKAAQKTFGYTQKAVLGKQIGLLYNDPEGEGLAVHEACMRTGQFVGEILNRRKSGEIFPSFLSASVLCDARGEIMGVMGISRDITEYKRSEQELNRYRSHLEELVKERTAELIKVNEELRQEIAERKRAEKDLARQAQELARSNSELRQFAYIASHDLQEPLRMVTI